MKAPRLTLSSTSFDAALHLIVRILRSVSFKLYDLNDTGKIEPEEMEQVLASINDTASYFGDPVLKRSQIRVCGV